MLEGFEIFIEVFLDSFKVINLDKNTIKKVLKREESFLQALMLIAFVGGLNSFDAISGASFSKTALFFVTYYLFFLCLHLICLFFKGKGAFSDLIRLGGFASPLCLLLILRHIPSLALMAYTILFAWFYFILVRFLIAVYKFDRYQSIQALTFFVVFILFLNALFMFWFDFGLISNKYTIFGELAAKEPKVQSFLQNHTSVTFEIKDLTQESLKELQLKMAEQCMAMGPGTYTMLIITDTETGKRVISFVEKKNAFLDDEEQGDAVVCTLID